MDKCCPNELGLETDLVRLGLEAMEQQWGQARALKALRCKSAKPCRADFIRDPLSTDQPDFGSESLAAKPDHNLSDSNSWLNAYLPELIQALWKRGHVIAGFTPQLNLRKVMCFLLSCGRLLNTNQLDLHRHNLVVHESDLPKGQGWSPMTWQILEGANIIPITLLKPQPRSIQVRSTHKADRTMWSGTCRRVANYSGTGHFGALLDMARSLQRHRRNEASSDWRGYSLPPPPTIRFRTDPERSLAEQLTYCV